MLQIFWIFYINLILSDNESLLLVYGVGGLKIEYKIIIKSINKMQCDVGLNFIMSVNFAQAWWMCPVSTI